MAKSDPSGPEVADVLFIESVEALPHAAAAFIWYYESATNFYLFNICTPKHSLQWISFFSGT